MTRALVLFVALLAACGNAKLNPDDARAALPQQGDSQIGAPTATVAAAGAPAGVGTMNASPASVAGDVSGYFVSTVTLAVAVNGSVAWSLGVLRAVVESPPTECDAASCTWGPGSHPLDPRDWKLVVTTAGDHFDYALSGELKSQPTGFVTVLSGSAWPGASPRKGHGTFLVDLDSAQALGFTGTGTLEVSYDNRTDLSIGATFLGFTAQDTGHKGNAVYAYAESATGGDLQVAFHDLTAAVDPELALHSRWNLAGAGRGDAAYAQTTPALSYTASECWSAAAATPPFRVVFYVDSTLATSGAESDCAFSPAAPPTLSAP